MAPDFDLWDDDAPPRPFALPEEPATAALTPGVQDCTSRLFLDMLATSRAQQDGDIHSRYGDMHASSLQAVSDAPGKGTPPCSLEVMLGHIGAEPASALPDRPVIHEPPKRLNHRSHN